MELKATTDELFGGRLAHLKTRRFGLIVVAVEAYCRRQYDLLWVRNVDWTAAKWGGGRGNIEGRDKQSE